MSYKSVPQEFPTRVAHKSVLQSVPQECPTRVSFGHISFSIVFAFGFVGSILFFIPRSSDGPSASMACPIMQENPNALTGAQQQSNILTVYLCLVIAYNTIYDWTLQYLDSLLKACRRRPIDTIENMKYIHTASSSIKIGFCLVAVRLLVEDQHLAALHDSLCQCFTGLAAACSRRKQRSDFRQD